MQSKCELLNWCSYYFHLFFRFESFRVPIDDLSIRNHPNLVQLVINTRKTDFPLPLSDGAVDEVVQSSDSCDEDSEFSDEDDIGNTDHLIDDSSLEVENR